jgi:hypothetical protein
VSDPDTSFLRFVHCEFREGAWRQPDESIVISVAHHAHPAPAQARSEKPDESIAIWFPSSVAQAARHRRVPRQGVHSRITTRFGRERPRALDPCALSPSERKQFRQTDLTRHDVYHISNSIAMVGRGITTLAFSCERT